MAVRRGLLTPAEALARYRLSAHELEAWEKAYAKSGQDGLRSFPAVKDRPWLRRSASFREDQAETARAARALASIRG